MVDSNHGQVDAVLRKLVKGGVVVFIGLIAELSISFVAKVIVGRYLPVADFGAINIALKLLTFTSIIGVLGLDTGIVRLVPRYEDPEARKGVFVSGYQLLLLSSILLAATVFLLSNILATQVFSSPGAATVFRIIALAIPANVLLRTTVSIRALERVVPDVVVKSFVWPVSRIGLIVLVSFLGGGIVHFASAYVVSYWIAGTLGFVAVVRYTPLFDRSTTWKPKYFEILRFSVPLSIAGTMGFVLTSVDTFMLGVLLPLTAVGIYSVAYTLGSLVNVPRGALSGLFLPLYSRIDAEGSAEDMSRIYITITKWMTFSALPILIGMVLFGPWIIYYSFGEKYVTGAPLLQVVAFGYFVQSLVGPNRIGLEAVGRTRVIMVINGIVATANIFLNYVLIHFLEVLGAAIATFITFLLLNVSISIVFYTESGIHPVTKAIYQPLVAMSFVLLSVGWTIKTFLPRSLLALVLFVLVGGTLYPFVIALAGGLSREDVMLINSVEERMGVDIEFLKRYVRWFIW